MTSDKLRDKIAIVTGAGGTLCGVMACDLARQGAAVALVGRTESKLRAVADKIAQDGGRSIVCVADVMEMQDLERVRSDVKQDLGDCSILLNGAGGNQASAIAKTTEFTRQELDAPDTGGFFNLDMNAFERVLDVNVMGTVKPSQVFGRDMAAAGSGVIINFASMTSYRPLSRVGAYAAAKAGIINFTQWLACYLAPAGWRIPLFLGPLT